LFTENSQISFSGASVVNHQSMMPMKRQR